MICVFFWMTNSKIGRENHWAQVESECAIHNDTSANLFVCANEELIIMSSCFDHRIIQKRTQKPPGWESIYQVNQIDDILMSSQHVLSTYVIDVKKRRWLNCDTDQFLVAAVLREKLSNLYNHKGVRRIKWDLDTLKDSDCE